MQFVPFAAGARLAGVGLRVLCLWALCGGAARGDELEYRIRGVEEPILANVQSHVEPFGITAGNRITRGQFEDTVEAAIERAREALKPFGYYHPSIATNLVEAGRGRWRLEMRITPGQPVRVRDRKSVV